MPRGITDIQWGTVQADFLAPLHGEQKMTKKLWKYLRNGVCNAYVATSASSLLAIITGLYI